MRCKKCFFNCSRVYR